MVKPQLKFSRKTDSCQLRWPEVLLKRESVLEARNLLYIIIYINTNYCAFKFIYIYGNICMYAYIYVYMSTYIPIYICIYENVSQNIYGYIHL